MKRQNGFTLIELVVVIIILGILAVTAAPKFINLQSDARQSALQGVKGAIQGANGLVFAKAALDGKEKSSTFTGTDVNIGTETAVINVKTLYGYLLATETDFSKAVDATFSLEKSPQDGTGDWIYTVTAGKVNAPGTMVIYQRGAPNDSDTCQLTYTEATSTTTPTYVIVDTGC
ncbi:prepilin-type N-terminal cleavage/methylation domain-containing protein [Shewanella atlantica]|uniref:Type II secretion system protein n=1 Tax=Shewanella atlantica TaxID=271099 RepID=A0A431W6W6_9GAMM|nr:prepilin-type N-terminal cleavage/methylation domain-containing protein [Shewanella atlantica]RTR31239.1 type II secretion system protein [Shewanella atlantica]